MALSNMSANWPREWERFMLDLVVNYWGRLISALITGGPAGYWLMARGRGSADDARGATEAKAAEDTRRAAEAKAAEDARRAAEAEAAEDARRAAEAKAAEVARRAAEAKAAKVVRDGAKAKAAEDARRVAEAKAVEAGRRVAKSKAAQGAPSCAATHPGKRTEEMAVPPADLRLIKGIVAKPTRAASQKRTAPRMKAK